MPSKRSTCSVCKHRNVRAINRALADPENSARSVAKEYDLNARTLQRHYSQCIGEVVKHVVAEATAPAGSAAPELTPAERAMGADIVYRVQHLQEETQSILQAALTGMPLLDKEGNPRLDEKGNVALVYQPGLALKAIGHVRKNLELIARLTGKLNGGGEDVRGGLSFEAIKVYVEAMKVGVRK